MRNSIRSRANTRNRPTPQATAAIRMPFGMEGTCPARTCRSGSDTVMIKPSRKERETISVSFLLFVMQVPTFSPMGVMESSAPSVKNIMPRTSRTAPIRKHKRILGEIGATEKQRMRTITMIGSTATSASRNFSISLSRKMIFVRKGPPRFMRIKAS